ncbi:MAG: CAP domain-containing protein [Flavisolibacter sp.]
MAQYWRLSPGYSVYFMKHFMVAVLGLVVLSAQAQDKNNSSTGKASPVNKTRIIKLINEARAKGCTCGDTWYAAVPALGWNNQLEAAALAHSNDMMKNKYFAHTGSDASTAGMRIEDAGYTWRNYGENIGQGYKTEDEVVDGWLHSPGHCRNIMSKDFKEMAVARSGDLWTQVFAAKK